MTLLISIITMHNFCYFYKWWNIFEILFRFTIFIWPFVADAKAVGRGFRIPYPKRAPARNMWLPYTWPHTLAAKFAPERAIEPRSSQYLYYIVTQQFPFEIIMSANKTKKIGKNTGETFDLTILTEALEETQNEIDNLRRNMISADMAMKEEEYVQHFRSQDDTLVLSRVLLHAVRPGRPKRPINAYILPSDSQENLPPMEMSWYPPSESTPTTSRQPLKRSRSFHESAEEHKSQSDRCYSRVCLLQATFKIRKRST